MPDVTDYFSKTLRMARAVAAPTPRSPSWTGLDQIAIRKIARSGGNVKDIKKYLDERGKGISAATITKRLRQYEITLVGVRKSHHGQATSTPEDYR